MRQNSCWRSPLLKCMRKRVKSGFPYAQDKENLTAYSRGEATIVSSLRGDTQASRPGYHTKKNNSFIRQRFQEVINRKSAIRKSWKSLHFWVNDSACLGEETCLH